MDALKIVDQAIDELISEYPEKKNYYFREREIHYIFFKKLSSLGELVHPEYPTRKRFKRIKNKKVEKQYIQSIHCFDPDIKKGKRGSYDIVVLNPEFYNYYYDNIVRLSSTKIDTNIHLNCKYIYIAIEFKYIKGTFDRLEVEYDLFKLKQANEVENKKLIIFTKRRPTDKNYDTMIKSLKEIKKNEHEIHIEIIED